MHISSVKRLKKKAKKGFKGHPVGTIAFYGPDNKRATKVVVGIIKSDGADADPLKRWSCEVGDIRVNENLNKEVLEFIAINNARSIVMPDRIIGCPHEEGTDYPENEKCPLCAFWHDKDRWTGDNNE